MYANYSGTWVKIIAAASFNSLTANGSSTVKTTKLTLIFDKDIEGLTADDITFNDGYTWAEKGALIRTGTGVYELSVSGIYEQGQVSVTVTIAEYYINLRTRSVTVYPELSHNSMYIRFVGPTEKNITVEKTIINNFSKNGGGSMTLSVGENFDRYDWFVGETKVASGKNVTLQASDEVFVIGQNWITVLVYVGTGVGAKPWSGEFFVMVND